MKSETKSLQLLLLKELLLRSVTFTKREMSSRSDLLQTEQVVTHEPDQLLLLKELLLSN